MRRNNTFEKSDFVALLELVSVCCLSHSVFIKEIIPKHETSDLLFFSAKSFFPPID